MAISNPERLVVEGIKAATANYTVSLNDCIVTAVQSININLLNPLVAQGQQIIIKKIVATAGWVTIKPPSGVTIDGDNTMVIDAEWESVLVYSNGISYFTGPANRVGDIGAFTGTFTTGTGSVVAVANGIVTGVS